jgi:hypothetical protein
VVPEPIAALTPPVDLSAASMQTAAPPPSDLRSQVSSMAQALTAYSASTATAATGPLAPDGAAPTPVAVAVSGMVSAMQQFDSNGNLQKPQAPSVPPLSGAQAANALKPGGADLLASTSGLKLPGA